MGKNIATHRCTNEALKSILQQQCIKAHSPECKLAETLDDSREVVWVSSGRPTVWNLVWSGMLEYRCTANAYIIFENNNMVRPNKVKKFFSYLGKSQMVIENDIHIVGKIIEVKYLGKQYTEAKEINELIEEIRRGD